MWLVNDLIIQDKFSWHNIKSSMWTHTGTHLFYLHLWIYQSKHLQFIKHYMSFVHFPSMLSLFINQNPSSVLFLYFKYFLFVCMGCCKCPLSGCLTRTPSPSWCTASMLATRSSNHLPVLRSYFTVSWFPYQSSFFYGTLSATKAHIHNISMFMMLEWAVRRSYFLHTPCPKRAHLISHTVLHMISQEMLTSFWSN